jgi:glutamyl-Q tRNA(Asp) synthetase
VTAAVHYRGRFAPSPTGPLHFGSLLAAFASWLDARHHGGAWLVRIEDVDRPREVVGAADEQLRTLAAFGLQPDEAPLRQSTRDAAYAAALQQLEANGDLFRCSCSRSELAASGGLHRACLHPPRDPAAIRLRMPDRRVAFIDRCLGPVEQALRQEVGDIVLRRIDGLWSYQLAVVVDDAAQGITDIVRGADLLESTPRQIDLQQRLGLPTPRYLHLPLVLDADGRKLGKSNAALPIAPEQPLAALRIAWSALGQAQGVLDDATDLPTLLQCAVRAWEPSRIGRQPLWLHELQAVRRPAGGAV